MKSLKKLLAFALVLVMLTALSVTAFAAGGTPSITIQPNTEDYDTTNVEIKYTYYKILSASIDTDPTVSADGAQTAGGEVAYYVENQAQATALTGTGLFTVTKVDGQNKWFVALTNSSTTAADIVAKFDATFLSNFTKQEYTKAKGAANAVLPNVTAGYYYIQSSIGTNAAVQTLSPITIKEKNSYPSLDKEFGTGGTDTTNAIAGIGNVIPYEVTIKIPANVAEKEIKIVDTITNGLTLNTAVTVSGGTTDYTSATFVQTGTNAADDTTTPPTKASTVYTLTIPAATVLANAGKTLKFAYTATVNKDAVVLEPETNTAHLEYDNSATPDVPVVNTKPVALDVQKVDSDKTTVLAGAKFKLYDAKTGGNEIPVVLVTAASAANGNVNVYRVAVSGETGVEMEGGTFRIEGLNDQKYYLEETVEPTGYNKLEERAEVEASEATAPATNIDYKIENAKGTALPSTGGIGTTLFYVLGSILVLGAGIVLVTKRRVQE